MLFTEQGSIGHLTREDAQAYQPLLTCLEGQGSDGGICPAFMRRAENGMLGVVLALSAPEICMRHVGQPTGAWVPSTWRPLSAGGLVSVVGESYYRGALEAAWAAASSEPPLPVEAYAEKIARDEVLPWIVTYLLREPENVKDENAIVVRSEYGVIGYLSRADAQDYQPVLGMLERRGIEAGACSAFLRHADNEMIGAALALSPVVICRDELRRAFRE